MDGDKPSGRDSVDRNVSRRTFVKAAGGAGVAMGLAGCYGDGGDSDGTTVSIGMGTTSIDNVKDRMPELLHENGVDDDITIDWNEQEEASGAQRDQYLQLLQAEEGNPDLMMVDNGWANILINRGLLENVTETLSDDVVSTIEDEYFGPFSDTVRGQNGDLYGVPLFPDFATMMYNKEYAREAGYTDEDFETWSTEPMTWSEWADLVQEITEASDAEYGFTTQWDIYVGTSCCTWNEVMTSFGGAYFGGRENLFGPVGDRPITIDEPEVIEGLRMMYTFATDEEDEITHDDYPVGLADPDIIQYTENSALSPFLQGEAAFHRNWPYALIEAEGDDYEALPEGAGSIGSMPIPYAVERGEGNQPGTGGSNSAQGGWHVALNPYTDNTDAAVQVMEAMTEEDFMLGMMEAQGWLPPKPSMFESETATDPEQVGVVGNHMDTLRVVGQNAMPRPSTSVWSTQSTTIAEQVNRAVAGEKTPEAAAADLQSAIEDIEESA
ncbi:extracellular solute-binding protein [Halorhabdus tiamatea SARL4B]|uniref:Extracellular solute-binding protein n=1 Tax=Halorhabdus tiamatea SARL4B TaxID=1033806 RepID=U2FEU7_9EURY|nr:extracellular solute-binding protein [Halorhabdus tiamatea]ERJ06809.1 extracellular solute-binding protein [Halorhabdus tiamatea SARL4B]